MSNKIAVEIGGTDSSASAFNTVSAKLKQLDADVNKISRRFSEMNSALTSMFGALTLGGLTMLTKSFIDAGLQTEKLTKLFTAAAGSANLGGREFEYVRGISEKLGLDLLSTAESYGKFMAAIRGTSLEGEAGRKVFESVSGATSALGLSADETKGIFNALHQMMSKGKVQAEELRGQLGERLPGAFKMAADAMGVSTAELDKMLKDGTVLADELLPKLAVQLDLTYGKAATEGARSAAAEINRMNNAMFEAKGAAGAALIPLFTDIVKAITPALGKLKEFIGGLQILAIRAAALWDFVSSGKGEKEVAAQRDAAIEELMKRYQGTGSDYTAADLLRQSNNKPSSGLRVKTAKAAKDPVTWSPGFMNWRAEQYLQGEESKYIKEQEKKAAEEAKEAEQAATLALQEHTAARKELGYQTQLNAELDRAWLESTGTMFQGFQAGWQQFIDKMQTVYQQGVQMAEEIAGGMERAFSDGFFNIMQGRINSLGKVFMSLIASVQRALANMLAQNSTNAIMQALQNVAGGLLNSGSASSAGSYGVLQSDAGYSWSAPTFHSGGYVPRFHFGGLASDEMPAILQSGEGVLSRKGMAALDALNAGKAAGGNVSVNLINQSGQQLQAEQQGQPRFDGAQMVVDIVLRKLKSDPSFRNAMATGGI